MAKANDEVKYKNSAGDILNGYVTFVNPDNDLVESIVVTLADGGASVGENKAEVKNPVYNEAEDVYEGGSVGGAPQETAAPVESEEEKSAE